MSGTVHLVRGDDPSLVGAAVTDLVHRLVGEGDRELMVEELHGDDYELGALVDAARTLPFLSERRVVVGRNLQRFLPQRGGTVADDEDDDEDDAAEVVASPGTLGPLLAYLAEPSPTTDLVLEVLKRATPRNLLDAVKKAGGVLVETTVKSTRDRAAFLEDHLATAGVRLDQPARALVLDRLGEDVARLASLLELLESTFGPGARLGQADVAPFVGEAGGTPPWDLTDAIDAGEVTKALGLASRMLGAGERHPLQLMAVLHGHYTKLLRLDGSPGLGEAEVTAMLKVAPFQAKKLTQTSRKLGRDGVHRAVALLAQADLDLRGARDLPPDVVLEVLVARLARLGPPRRR